MATLLVVLDQEDNEWDINIFSKKVRHARLDIDNLELTEAEIEQHATTLVKMLLSAIQISSSEQT